MAAIKQTVSPAAVLGPTQFVAVDSSDFWLASAPAQSQQEFQIQGLMVVGAEAWAVIVMIGAALAGLAFWSGYRLGSRTSVEAPGRRPPRA